MGKYNIMFLIIIITYCLISMHNFLVRYITLSSSSCPWVCTSLVSSGKALESRINLTWTAYGEPRIFISNWWSGGQLLHFSHQRPFWWCLVCSKDEHTMRRCCIPENSRSSKNKQIIFSDCLCNIFLRFNFYLFIRKWHSSIIDTAKLSFSFFNYTPS